MTTFTIPWMSLYGGMLLGVSAVLLLIFNGKIAGISGIFSGAIMPKNSNRKWQITFLLSMIIGGIFASNIFAIELAESFPFSPLVVAIGGLLVGAGTKLGNGCTSGHGICGMGRLSKRSIIATLIFMTSAIVTVFIQHHLLG